MSDFANINLDEIEEISFSGEPLPDGAYKFFIDKSYMKAPKSGGEKYLALELSVAEGEHKNRKHFCNLNINHANDTARNIARARFKELCMALGIKDPATMIAEDFVDKQIMGRLKTNTKANQNLVAFGPIEKIQTPPIMLEDDDIPFE